MNKILFISILTVLCYSVYSSPVSIGDDSSKKSLNGALHQVDECTFKMCFAIDGSNFITPDEFLDVKVFIDLVTHVLRTSNSQFYSAGQFGKIAYPITMQTNNFAEFTSLMEKEKKISDTESSLSVGIEMCDSFLSVKKPKGPNIMVLIGKGNNNSGSDPVASASTFRSRDPVNKLLAVEIKKSDSSLLDDIVGKSGEVLTLDDFFKVAEIVGSVLPSQC